MKYNKPVENEFCVSGTILATQKEPLHWIDKTTGLPRDGVRFSVILQTSCGVFFCRSFNPSEDLVNLKSGDQVYLPIDRFEKDNGMKVVTLAKVV